MRYTWIYWIVGLFFLSCTERIDIHTDDATPRLVIYGKISTERKPHLIRITRSTGYFASDKPGGVGGADVKIITEEGVEYRLYPGDVTGDYITPNSFFGIENQTYTMQVKLDFDEDGVVETYEASSYLPPKATLDGLRIVPSAVFQDVMEIQLSANLPEKKNGEINGYLLHFYQGEKALNDSLKNLTVFDDEHISTRRLDTLACYYIFMKEGEIKLKPGDQISLRAEVTTKAYSDFVAEAQREMGGSIPIFSGPPANVRTNIRCKEKFIPVAGFFTAFSYDEMTIVYYPTPLRSQSSQERQSPF